MTISLCMIVKDEEAQLPRCLASVEGVVDEIVVVDTGSTDRTREIAAAAGARVLESPWDGSFSSARNVSLDAATGDWILILDADEALTRGELLRQAAERQDVEAYCLPLVNFVGDRAHEEAVTSPAVRLFRNRAEYRYTRALHEQIMYAVLQRNPEAVLGYLDAPIEHYGYLNQLVAGRDKIRRNLAIARQEVERYPKDAFSWYNLGQEYFRLAEWQQAVDAYRKGFPYLESLAAGYAPALVKHLIVALLNLQRPDEALAVAADAKEAYDQYTDLWALSGLAQMQKGDFASAAAQFEHALRLGEAGGAFYISDEGVGSYKAAWWLGHCLVNLGRLEEAEAWFTRSLSELAKRGRYLAVPLDGLLQIARLRGLSDGALRQRLSACVDLTDRRWRELLARRLMAEDRPELGLALVGQLAEVEAETLLALGSTHLRRRDPELARRAFDAVPANHPLRSEADWYMVLTEAVAGHQTACVAAFERAVANSGPSSLAALYGGLVALWRGADPHAMVLPELPEAAELRGHLTAVLALFLQVEAYELFERSLPALGWLGLCEAEQATLLGHLYSEAGLTDMAIEALVLALEAGDTSDATLRLLGKCCLRQGRYAEAESLLAEALRRQAAHGVPIGPQNAALLAYLAALSAQGRDCEAEPLWQALTAESGLQPSPTTVAATAT